MKHITSMIITISMLASLAMVSCNKNTQEPANTAGTTTPAVTTEAVSTTGETENVVTTFEETTEPTSELPEFDINSDECLLYRLLDMTVDEIEAEFGELKFFAIVGGGTPCYQLPEYGLRLYFYNYPDFMEAPLPRDYRPRWIEAFEYKSAIYPGMYVGMDSHELNDIFEIDDISLSLSDFFTGFNTSFLSDGYRISVNWDIPEELDLKTQKAICWGDDNDEETAKAELIEGMKSGNANVKIGKIILSKQFE